MNGKTVYEELAERLDRGVIIGVPISPSGIEILKELFPDEEAKIALLLPMEQKTLAELKGLLPDEAGSLGEILDRMAKRGTVFTMQKPGRERVYSLLPVLVGFAETPYWAGKDTETTRNLAPLWLKYREEAFGEELARGMPAVRVIPVSESLKDESEILPFDVIKSKLDEVSYLAVGHCPCRQIMRYTGKGCDHTLENCLHFGSMGRYIVEQGMAREITREEALEILTQADEEGLVHVCDNLEGPISTLCNCCSCCCVFLQTKRQRGLHVLSSSSYVSQVDDDICAGCGTCEDRCPVDAIEVSDDDIAVVNGDLCIGCGVCTPTCPTGAIGLIQREGAKPPPDVSEFLELRYKA
ncbi:MAG: 4Fe-4S binding protein [Deltaproteobacteria bacterium]|nr:4Fe-4S binding protein [Deltaproteobacteria bacterium]